VELSTGQLAIVVKNYEATGLRPKVRIISGDQLTKDYLDLTRDTGTLNITIRRIADR